MKYPKFWNKCVNTLGLASGVLTLVIAVLSLLEAILLYFLHSPTSWTLTVSQYILLYIVFWAADTAPGPDQHRLSVGSSVHLCHCPGRVAAFDAGYRRQSEDRYRAGDSHQRALYADDYRLYFDADNPALYDSGLLGPGP